MVVQTLHGGDDAGALSRVAEAAAEGDKTVHGIAHDSVQKPNWGCFRSRFAQERDARLSRGADVAEIVSIFLQKGVRHDQICNQQKRNKNPAWRWKYQKLNQFRWNSKYINYNTQWSLSRIVTACW